MAKQKEEAPKVKKGYQVGDKVKVDGKPGVISEVGTHDDHWLANHPQMYGVKLDELLPITDSKGKPAKDDDGNPITYQNTLGGIPEIDISPR